MIDVIFATLLGFNLVKALSHLTKQNIKDKKMRNFKVSVFLFSLILTIFISMPVLAQQNNDKNAKSETKESYSEDDLFKMLGVRNMTNEQAPSFVLKDVDGNEVSLEKLKGKVVFIDFWATWCGPCREEMPFIEKLTEEFKSKGLVTLTVTAEKVGTVNSFLVKNNYKIKSLIDEGKVVSAQYQVKGLPTAFIVDKEGKIVTHFIGGRDEETLRNELKKAGIGGL